MVLFCLLNLIACFCIGLGRVYFTKPVIENPAPEVRITEKPGNKAIEPSAV